MLRQIVTENGIIEGMICSDPRITAFRGVPYAAPPVGELRWRAPQPHDNWEGVYHADRYAPMEVQSRIGVDQTEFFSKEFHPTAAEYEMSEDCLYFNMWSPAKSTEDNLPIYVWFHGGGLQTGYSYEMEVDGERMAREGVIVVSVGYRINVFGWLAHPELTAEEPGMPHGNYCLQDIICCIEYLKRNARAFGGDPNRITVGGQSGSAFGSQCLAVSPMTRGLITGMIAESGGGIRRFGYGTGCVELSDAEEDGKKFLEFLGVENIAQARECSAEACYEAYQKIGRGVNLWAPKIDGVFLTEESSAALINGHQNDINYLYGSTADEGGFIYQRGKDPETLEELIPFAEAIYKEDTPEFLEWLKANCPTETKEDIRNLFYGDGFSARGIAAQSFAKIQSKAPQGTKGYCYLFGGEVPGEDNPGAFHGSELLYVFNNLDKSWRPYEGRHYDLSRIMVSYWTNFIKTGDPNGTDRFGRQLPEWKCVEGDAPFIMEIKGDRPVEGGHRTDKCGEYRIAWHFKKFEENDGKF